MKIKEAIVIDNKLIDELMAECMHSAVYEVLECIRAHSKPLDPIVRNFHTYGQFAKMELLATSKINIHSVDQYIKEIEI